MTENPYTAVARAIGFVLVVVLGAAVFFWMPLPDIDLPFDLRLSRPFDVPEPPWWLRWLPFLVGPGKLLLLGIVVAIVTLAQAGKKRSGPGDGTTTVSLVKK